MTAIRKRAAAITTAVLLGAGLAAPAQADSAWLGLAERAKSDWTQADDGPRPMDPSYFADKNETSRAEDRAAESEREGPFAALFDEIVDGFENLGG
jgi:hypothetical protein